MPYQQILITSNTTGTTSGAGTEYLSSAPSCSWVLVTWS